MKSVKFKITEEKTEGFNYAQINAHGFNDAESTAAAD